ELKPGIVLRGANLRGADWSKEDLHGVTFIDVDLRNARLYRVDLSGARLLRVKLDGAELAHAYFSGAVLRSVSLRDSTFQYGDLSAMLDRVDLREAYLNCVGRENASLRRDRLRGLTAKDALWPQGF